MISAGRLADIIRITGRRKTNTEAVSKLGAILYCGILLVWATGFLSFYLPVETFWWTGLFAFGLPFSSLAVVLLLPYVIRHRSRRWVWGLYLIAVAAIALRFVHPSGWFRTPEASPQDLVVMTYNIPPIPLVDLEPTRKPLVESVTSYNPHLIGIPEGVVLGPGFGRYRSTKQEKFRPLTDSLGYRTLQPPPTVVDGRAAWKNPTLLRIPYKTQEQLNMRHPDSDYEEGLLAVRTEFSWGGRDVVHYNVYLASHGNAKPWRSIGGRPRFSLETFFIYFDQMRRGFLRRSWQARKLKERIDSEKLPVIVSGDFNSTPHNWAYRILSHGLSDAFRSGREGWGATYHVRLPLFRIDFVLVSDEWEVVWADVPEGDPIVSDHRPVVAWLRLR